MRTFIFTSDLMQGEVELVYNDNEQLDSCDFSRSNISERQQIALLKIIPVTAGDINVITPTGSSAKITEVFKEITFDDFWKRYDDKLNSSKKKTLIRWNKMPKNEQIKAYNYIYKYFNSIPSGTRKKYAETYLNAELWNN